MREFLNLLGAALIVASSLPYVIDVIKRRSRPNVVSWFTWTLIVSIGGFAALSAGEVRTAILTFADAVSVALVLGLGFAYGYAKFSWFDGLCQVGAIVGLILWFVFNSPTVAIVATITIDFIAALPTFRHSWIKPYEETWQTYFVTSIGAAIGICSLQAFSINSLAYPMYAGLLGLALSGAIVVRRKALRRAS